ncbi:MAG: RNA-binding transcriptional accessory protein [Burkholderiaceae bacterium]|nr:MAG: RNA-binding transcriptional accessory protein [Burkholderiaceae bacterium]
MQTQAAARIIAQIATEIGAAPTQVEAAATLLDEGATVPFIARYRKEATGGLDDTQLRVLAERLLYLRELEERRSAVLASIAEQNKLTPELQQQIEAAGTKQALEDLYLPYKPKRRTRAQIAREAGLEPLAHVLLADPSLTPASEAEKYLNAEAGINDTKAALDGARDILCEQFAETAALLGRLRDGLWQQGILSASVIEEKRVEGEKFRDYFEFSETIRSIPSHRALALLRGRNAGVLLLKLDLEDALATQIPHPCVAQLAAQFGIAQRGRPADTWLLEVCRWCWRVKVQPQLESELVACLREVAELEAIKVFGRNLKDLLLAAPAGPKAVMGLDPGIRTGVKVAVVDATGKLLDTATIYPHEPRRQWDQSLAVLAALASKHDVQLIAIGNGTASRETDKLAAELMQQHPQFGLTRIVVSEAGASVYSASELAAQEFPDLDVSLRGAVSIARRLQDPLAELVKIDPKSIGVGQYQHDVNQRELARALDAVVEDCVNAVGVDVNTASTALLARVSGLNAILAKNLVEYREQHGAYTSRATLKNVPRLGDKTFEQAAGFLRINQGDNPLDRSAVHPEAYPVVERILQHLHQPMQAVMGNKDVLKTLAPAQFSDARFGLPTVKDILQELEKPGRDPRPEFKAASFREGVESLADLEPGMVLEGVVTNVANFGAFVDIGVHQDGLVHISALADKYVKDPHSVVKAGDVVKVRVLEVDVARKRIALTLRMNDATELAHKREKSECSSTRQNNDRALANSAPRPHTAATGGAMAEAFARLQKR